MFSKPALAAPAWICVAARAAGRWARVAAALLALGAGLLALLVYGWILPHLNDYRPHMERMASRALGVPVHIERVEMTRSGWEPLIEMRQLVLRDPTGGEGLRVARVQAQISMPSIMRLGFERLSLFEPSLYARRNTDGALFVAGMRVRSDGDAQQGPELERALNWLLAQPQLHIQRGKVHWSDAKRSVPLLVFSQIQATLENARREHTLQINVTPPQDWGQPLQFIAQWKHSLWSARGAWRTWAGMAYADVPQLDVSQLRRYADWGPFVRLRRGLGSVRLWSDFNYGAISSLTMELALHTVDATLGRHLPPLTLQDLSSTLSLRREHRAGADVYTLETQKLRFTTQDGLSWPQGDVRMQLEVDEDAHLRSGQLWANNCNLHAIGQLASRLPLGDATLRALNAFQPSGMLRHMQLQWTGDINQPQRYTARGAVSQLSWLEQRARAGSPPDTPGIAGVQNADVDFDCNEQGGRMDIAMQNGAITLPGVFEEPRLVFERLNARARWRIQGSAIELALQDVAFANADAQGSLRMTWRTSDVPPGQDAAQRLPGIIDLEAHLQRASGQRVHRYLPLALGDVARHYVRDAVRAGDISNARIRVQGRVADIPFGASPGQTPQGVFLFEVPLRNAHYVFVPSSLQDKGELPWPALTQLSGLLVIDRNSLYVRDATARLSTAPDLKVHELAASIPELDSTYFAVGVAARASGPLGQALHLTNASPLGAIAHDALKEATATGNADLTLTLGLPVLHMRHAQVQGTVKLNGNDIRIAPGTPLLGAATGKVAFSHKGFALENARAHLLGGAMQLTGGSVQGKRSSGAQAVRFAAQGHFSAQGLRNERELGFLSALGQYMHGSSAYRASLQFAHGLPELDIRTDLQGMSITLPAPLSKAASHPLPLHYANTAVTASAPGGQGVRDLVQLRLGDIITAQYLRRRDARLRRYLVLSGSVAAGQQACAHPPPMPEQGGVQATALLDAFDADAWQEALERAQAATQHGAASNAAAAPQDDSASEYLPTTLALYTPQLRLNNRRIEQLALAGTRQGDLWSLSVDARQISGQLQVRLPDAQGAGSVHAVLNRLLIEPALAREVKTLVDQSQDPQRLPALDIKANNVVLLGYALSHLQLQANADTHQGSGGAWRIYQLLAQTPHGTLTGSGTWGTASAAPAPAGPANAQAARRPVALNLRLDTDNLGALLAHMGWRNVVRGGAGSATGELRWRGSPLWPEIEHLDGALRADVRNGLILKIDPGAARLLALLSLQALPRMNEVGAKGFAFDRINGTLRIHEGLARSQDLRINGVLADVQLTGQANLAQQSLQAHALVRPKIDLGNAALVAAAINPLMGVGSYVAQWLLSGPFSEAGTQTLQLSGPWAEPSVSTLKGQAAREVQAAVQASHRAAAAAPPDALWNWSPVTRPSRSASASTPTPAP